MTKDNNQPEGDTLDWREEFRNLNSVYLCSHDHTCCWKQEEVETFIEQTISKELEKQKEEIMAVIESGEKEAESVNINDFNSLAGEYGDIVDKIKELLTKERQ